VAVVIILVVGLWAQMPYLTVEHRRLEPWKIVELWCADILALFWFVRFTIVHALQGEPLVAVLFEDGRRRIKVIAMIGTAALLIDLVFSFYLMNDERERYAKGLTTEARVTAVREIKRSAATWYELECSFKDNAGLLHETHLRAEAEHHVLPTTLPPETVQVLTSHGHNQNLIRIRYDPEFPARAWIDGLGWDDGNRIYWFSLLALFFQAIVTAIFLLQLMKHATRDFLPWWWDIYKILPLASGAFWLFTFGLIDHLLDSSG
jgi:hypothetical protein